MAFQNCNNQPMNTQIKFLFAGTIFSSAFMLFLVQPLISKHILPRFGGSAAVWDESRTPIGVFSIQL